VAEPGIFIWGAIIQGPGDGNPQWDPGAKSPRSGSSLQTSFTDFDYRNDQNLKISQNLNPGS